MMEELFRNVWTKILVAALLIGLFDWVGIVHLESDARIRVADRRRMEGSIIANQSVIIANQQRIISYDEAIAAKLGASPPPPSP